MENKRNYGIDLFRIFSMLCVVTLHVLGRGGVLKESQEVSTLHWAAAWFLEIGAYGAVNCFALISGFVGYQSNSISKKISNYLYLWIQVVFYCVLFALIFNSLYPNEVTREHFWQALLPVGTRQYWYFTAYAGVVLCSPLFNCLVRGLDKKRAVYAIGLIIVVFSGYSTVIVLQGDPFVLSKGYSFLWIACMYILGAICCKYELYKKITAGKAVIWSTVLVLFMWVAKIVCDLKGSEQMSKMFVSYLSPAIVISSVLLLLAFAKIKIGKRGQIIIRFFAPTAFGVYLIHVNPLVWKYIMLNRFEWIARLPVAVLVLATILAAIVIFIGCSLVDRLRYVLFELLHIRAILDTAMKKTRKIMSIKAGTY